MSRFTKATTIEKLKNFILEKVNYIKSHNKDYYDEEDIPTPELLSIVPESDIKVKFDNENFEDPMGSIISEKDEYNGGIGFYQLDDLAIMLCYAGGDWEQPVWFCFYIDEKDNLRLYIPTKGNTYNIIFKTAYGSEEENPDYKKLFSKVPDIYKEDPNDETNYSFSDKYYEEFEKDILEANIDEMLEDIKNRIKVIK